MATSKSVFVYVGTYPDEKEARSDYEQVKALKTEGIETYDAAVVTKDEDGDVHVAKDERATRQGAWGGAAAGALVGILFPPALIGTALAGAAVGGVSGHLWRGMSRKDVKELGDVIDEGEAALVIVADGDLQEALSNAPLHPEHQVAKKLDVRSRDIDKTVKETVGAGALRE